MNTQAHFSECCGIDDDRPVRQGDVIEWIRPSLDPWSRLGIIVTADCDIAHEKHRGILSYVPLLTLTDYLSLFYIPRKIERACRPLREQLVKRIQTFQAQNAPEFKNPISEEAALRWVRIAQPERICEDLQVPEGKERNAFLSLARDLIASEAGLCESSFETGLEALLRARERQGGASREKLTTNFWSDVETLVLELPGDAFFIGSMGPDHRVGYVAYLRMVREILQSSIAVKQTDLRDSSVGAKRFARLTSPYVYRLTQKLAEVFSAIGLPGEYEDARMELLKRVAMPSSDPGAARSMT